MELDSSNSDIFSYQKYNIGCSYLRCKGDLGKKITDSLDCPVFFQVNQAYLSPFLYISSSFNSDEINWSNKTQPVEPFMSTIIRIAGCWGILLLSYSHLKNCQTVRAFLLEAKGKLEVFTTIMFLWILLLYILRRQKEGSGGDGLNWPLHESLAI